MKVLCVIPYYYPATQYGGPIASVHGLNKSLVKQGIDVSVYTTDMGIEDRVEVGGTVVVDGVKVTYFKHAGSIGSIGLGGWGFSPGITMAIKHNIAEYDLVYINVLWSYPAAIACHYSRIYSKPYVIATRGMLYGYTMGKKAWKKWPYYHLIAKRYMRNASAIHYTTHDEANQCHDRLGLLNKAIVVPNGIDPDEYSNKEFADAEGGIVSQLAGKRVILFLGRVHWIKGLDILAKAFGLIARNRDDVHLLIAGPDENGYKKKIQKLLDDEEVLGKVTFINMLKGEEKRRIFSISNIFVLPSYSENFGIVVIEAMASGVPVVVSENVGVSDDVRKEESGIVVSLDSKQLAAGLQKLLDNPDLGVRMGEQGRKVVKQRYAWDKVAGSMIEVFNQIVKSA